MVGSGIWSVATDFILSPKRSGKLILNTRLWTVSINPINNAVSQARNNETLRNCNNALFLIQKHDHKHRWTWILGYLWWDCSLNVHIIFGGIIGIHCTLDCRCPEVPPRPELGEPQRYCGKELKGKDCLPETIYKCLTFNQTIAEPPKRKIDDNCAHKRWTCILVLTHSPIARMSYNAQEWGFALKEKSTLTMLCRNGMQWQKFFK